MQKNFLKTSVNTQQRKAGFTLIELLIVISIMAILTVVAMGSFTSVQRQARINFAADTLVSAFREVKVLAASGRTLNNGGGEAAKLQCYAIKIVTGASGGLWIASTDYIGLEAIVPGISGGQIDTCEIIAAADQTKWQQRDIFDGDIMIKSILEEGGTGSDEQVFYLKPPFGQIYQLLGNNLTIQHQGLFDYVIGVADKPEFDSKVEFDLSTGNAKKVELI